MKIPLILLMSFLSASGFSQTPGLKWTKYLNTASGFSHYNTYIFDSRATGDGGLVLAGIDTGFTHIKRDFLNKYSSGRAWIAKVDTVGNKVWNSFATAPIDPHASAFLSVCTSSSGLYVAAGHGKTSAPSPSDFYLASFNTDGVFQWQNLYGGAGIDRAYSIQSTNDGGFILAGFTTSSDGDVSGNHSPGIADVWLVKINAARIIQWQKCYGGTGADSAYSVLETPDNGFIVAGVSGSSNGDLTGNNGLSDGWVFKTDNIGNIAWQKNIGGAAHEAFKNIVANSDGSYTLTGYTASASVPQNGFKGQTDLWVLNIAGNSGNIIWSKGYGGTSDEQGFSIKRTIGNGYLVGGFTESSDGDVTNHFGRADAWLLALANDGSLVWQKTIGSPKGEYAMTAHYLSSSDFAITGFANPAVSEPFDSTDGYVTRLGNVNTIKGLLFLDNNSNGIKDVGELPFSQGMVQAVKPGYLRQSLPINGLFQMDVDTGAYTTSVFLQFPYYNAVPASRNSSFVTYFNTDSFSFAIQPIAGMQDLNIQAIPLNVARPGFPVTYKLYYKNAGTVTIPNGTILFKRDSRLNLVSAIPPISTSSGDTLKWNYTNLAPFDTASITLMMQVSTPPTVNIGDTISSVAIILPVAGDLTSSDDTAFIRQRVQGSYDPNDKSENLAGRIFLQHISTASYINYLIRYQNTGTDTAFSIIVRDTLDPKLEWKSLQMIASSHPYQLHIKSENQLAWNFNNIRLVDSNTNEKASHGFIAYRIKPKNNLVVGDIIKNSASIYFDYNIPVKTNTQETVVTNNVSIVTGVSNPQIDMSSMILFPNPTGEILWVKVKDERRGDGVISIIDLNGREILRKNLGNINGTDFTTSLDMSKYPSGVYTILLNIGKNQYSQKLILQ